IFLPSHLGESVLVHAGQMLIAKPDAKNLPNPVDVDIRQIRKTSRLIRGFGKMGSEDLIAQTEAEQDEERGEGELYETNLAIYGGGTNIILNDLTHVQSSGQENAQAPSEFGPPETIPAPDAYPLISVSQTGITKLALIGVGGIFTGPPGGTLTFSGLDSVLLATQNGSIILDSGISFENIPNLFFYARGDSVSLKLASPISGSGNLL